MRIHLLLLCSVIVSLVNVHAQTITTDYNTCLTGVKDNYSNEWLIQPKYESVDKDQYGFIVSLGGKYGLIDKAGRERIPLMYDKLTELYRENYWHGRPKHFYVATNNDLLGIVDTANHVIAPIIYESYRTYRDSNLVAMRDNNDMWYFYNLRGGVFKAPWKSQSGPRMEGPRIYTTYKPTLFGIKTGLFNDSGRVIIEQKYDHISGYDGSELLYVTKGRKYGYCSHAGKFIWPMVFTHERKTVLHTEESMVARYGVGPGAIDGKYGLITAQGDTLLPFVYSDIQPFFKPMPNANGILWLVKDKDRSGIYHDREGWKIPIGCELIRALEDFYSKSDSLAVGLLLYKLNGLYGVKTTSGQEILPCEYEDATNISEDAFVFRKGNDVTVLGINTYANLTNLKYAAAGDTAHSKYYAGGCAIQTITDDYQFSVYRGEENTIAYYNSTETQSKLWHNGEFKTYCTGNSYSFVVPDSIIVACAFYVQHLPQPVIQSDVAKLFSLNRLYRHVNANHTPKLALIPSKKSDRITEVKTETHSGPFVYHITSDNDVLRNGELIINGDSVDRAHRRRFGHNGQLYFVVTRSNKTAAVDTTGKCITPYRELHIGDLNGKYSWRGDWSRATSYQLEEINTGKIIINTKEQITIANPIWDSITIVSSDKNGTRLFNIPQRKYLTAEGFNRIIPLSLKGNVFAVKTCSGNMGIMDLNGKWICDTIWQTLAPVQRLVHFDPYAYTIEEYNSNFYRYYFFTNDTGHAVYDAVAGSMKSPAMLREELWNVCAFSVMDSDFSNWILDSLSRHSQSYSQFFMRSEEAAFLNWQKDVILDTVNGSRRGKTYFIEESLNIEGYYTDEIVCRFCAKRGLHVEPYAWTSEASYRQNYVLIYKNEYALSFASTPTAHLNFMDKPEYKWYSNVMLFSDGPHSMLLDSLFNPASDWRNFIINTVITYVNTHRNITGDCSNPAAFPLMLKDNFLFTAEGLQLFPPGFSESEEQLVIPVPWASVNTYLREDLKSKLPLNNR